jgi:hypothetical protein
MLTFPIKYSFILFPVLKEFEKDLIAVLLVVESVHDKNKLLYKYEQINADKQRRNYIFISLIIEKVINNFYRGIK